jgi:hypothetical protein
VGDVALFELEKDGKKFVATRDDIEKLYLFPIQVTLGFVKSDNNNMSDSDFTKRKNATINLSLTYSEQDDTVKLNYDYSGNVYLEGNEKIKGEIPVPKEDFVSWFDSNGETWFQFDPDNPYRQTLTNFEDYIVRELDKRHLVYLTMDGRPSLCDTDVNNKDESIVSNTAGMLCSNGVPLYYLYVNRINLDTGTADIDVTNSVDNNKNLDTIVDTINKTHNQDNYYIIVQLPKAERSLKLKITSAKQDSDRDYRFYTKFDTFVDNPFTIDFTNKKDITKALKEARDNYQVQRMENKVDALSDYLDIDDLL